jgi:hypothetical protein
MTLHTLLCFTVDIVAIFVGLYAESACPIYTAPHTLPYSKREIGFQEQGHLVDWVY